MAASDGLRCGNCRVEIGPDDVFCQECGVRLVEVSSGVAGTTLTADNALSEATRLMCAGAYLDESFTRKAVTELFGQVARAVPPSLGFDVRRVGLHCLAARSGWRVRDALLTGLALIMLVFGAINAVWFGMFWAGVGWLVGALRDGPDGLRRALDRLTWPKIWLVAGVAALGLFVTFVWTVVAVAHTAGQLAASGPTPSPTGSPGLDAVAPFVDLLELSIVLGIAGWFVLYLIVLIDLARCQQTAVGRFGPAAFVARPEPAISLGGREHARLRTLATSQSDNATVYSGFDPFVGAGQALQGWSFAIPLVRAEGRKEVLKDFSVVELVRHVQRRIESIAANGDAVLDAGRGRDTTIRGLTVSDRVFVHGLAIDGDRRFLPTPAAAPRTHLTPQEMQAVAGQPHGAVRHYCAVHIHSWRGEIVTSMFFHFSTDGEKLYFEWVKRVLGPVRHEFHRIDLLPAHLSLRSLVHLAAEAATRTVPLVLGAPFRVVGDLVFDLRGGDPQKDTVIDYGAKLSVRELAAETRTDFSELGCHNYFQELDVDKHLKVVQRHAMAAILEFLSEHGVDTSEFSNRSATILDSSVTIIGSGITVGAVATGQGATASQSGGSGADAGRAPQTEGARS